MDFKLSAILSATTAAELAEQLSAGFRARREVVLDASSVRQVDLAGIQLLLAFAIKLESKQCTLSWHAVSPELLRAARLAGVISHLQLEPDHGR